MDVMTLSWQDLQVYTFPPLALVEQVIFKTKDEVQLLILIALYWLRELLFALFI